MYIHKVYGVNVLVDVVHLCSAQLAQRSLEALIILLSIFYVPDISSLNLTASLCGSGLDRLSGMIKATQLEKGD